MDLTAYFKRWNRIGGLLVWVVAAVVFLSTREPSTSLWDCGEFLSASYRLEVVHPPGAPFFLMLNRLFALPAPSPDRVASFINAQSALSSAFAALILFWTITFLAWQLIKKRHTNPDKTHVWAALGAGLLGALTFIFTDTFWFNAVEAEVYALSTLFMALVFWLMIVWEQRADEPDHLKWIVLIAYLAGLSVGVHLLSLLAIPALGVIWYFRRGGKITFRGALIGGLIGVAALAFFQVVMLKGIPTVASKVELLFVNTFGMPYWSGVLFFIVLVFAAMAFLAYYFYKKRPNPHLYSLAIVVIMVLIAYTSYAMVVIRSHADPPVDMNNPEDVFSLMSYINREQYGDRPFLYGPWFNARPVRVQKGDPLYWPKDGKYVVVGHRIRPEYAARDQMFFPRMGDPRPDRQQAYMAWENLRPGQKPTMGQNLHFFFTYQIGHMFWRYFAWNFLGRQNDIPGLGGELLAGNWLTGIKPLDEMRLGPQDNLPYFQRTSRAYNPLFMIPFVLGLLGLWYQFKHNKRWAWPVFAFFFMTGVALILYLNNPPIEPRERDYTLIGAFYVFAMWVGLGGLVIFDYLRQRFNLKMAGAALALLAVGVPLLTASTEWDDHDRSERYIARSIGWNYLMSCDSNAILFASGDNETYPLWYIQEVEGVRRDVRVINLSLLSTDWYHVELRQPTPDGAPGVPFTIPVEKLLGKREYFMYQPNALRIPQDQYVDLKKIIQILTSDDPRFQLQTVGGERVNFLPTKKFKVPVDSAQVVRSGIVRPEDYPYIVDEMRFEFPKNTMMRADLLVLDLIAHTDWTRPICFSTTTGPDAYLGLEPYFRRQGLIYRVTPVRKSNGPWIDEEKMYDIVRHRFDFGGVDERKMWVDYFSYISVRNYRVVMAYAAKDLLQKGDTARAVELIDYGIEKLPEHNVRYDFEMNEFAKIYLRARAWEKARQLIARLVEIHTADARYYRSLDEEDLKRAMTEFQRNQSILFDLGRALRATPLEKEFLEPITQALDPRFFQQPQ